MRLHRAAPSRKLLQTLEIRAAPGRTQKHPFCGHRAAIGGIGWEVPPKFGWSVPPVFKAGRAGQPPAWKVRCFRRVVAGFSCYRRVFGRIAGREAERRRWVNAGQPRPRCSQSLSLTRGVWGGRRTDRHAWLEEWCQECWAAPGGRCRRRRLSRRVDLPARLHVARGWRAWSCSTCTALEGDPCCSPSGREAARPHAARSRPRGGELLARRAVWEELERRCATIAVVPFSGRAGLGGRVGIVLSRLDGAELVDVERWAGRDELAYALEAPVWDRFGGFVGGPSIRGSVGWMVAERRVVIEGERGSHRFEEEAP